MLAQPVPAVARSVMKFRNPLKESRMSAVNGDKSRFHRERKQNIARRKRSRELLAAATKKSKATDAPVSAKPIAVQE